MRGGGSIYFVHVWENMQNSSAVTIPGNVKP